MAVNKKRISKKKRYNTYKFQKVKYDSTKNKQKKDD